MTVEYKIIDNADERFPGQVCIVCVEDGVETSRSWAPPDVDPSIRLNPDVPVAGDERSDTPPGAIAYRVLNVEEAAACGLDPDQHRVVATYAAVVGAVPVEDAAAACGVPKEVLIDEANGWAAAGELSVESR